MKPLLEAQAEVLDAVVLLPVARVPLHETRGLVPAEAIVAAHDIPPFANSAMDGYAVRAEDVVETPAMLTVLEDVPAGSVATHDVVSGTAVKIMTGAPLPAGADTVVKVEHTEPADSAVRILVAAQAGEAVRPAGDDVVAGDVVLDPGLRLTPAHLGLLASIGVAFPKVHRRPVVAIMSTGDEIVPPETRTLSPGKIRDANRFVLRGLLEDLGAVVADYEIVPDDIARLNRTLSHAADSADIVITSGGVSMGEYDLIKQELSKLGTVDFWKIAMKPAKPFAFGSVEGTPLFGLPGNPVSVFVAFEQFVRPALLKMMGAQRLFRRRIEALTDEELVTDPAKTVFVRVSIDESSGDARVVKSGGQGSHILSALAAADAFAVVQAGVSTVALDEAVEVELFRSPESRTRREALYD